MSGDIFLLQHDDQLVEMNEQAYPSEALLQKLLAQHPKLLAGNKAFINRRLSGCFGI
jgi:hypothetical protein